tara:strand:+ start:5412 stop:7640 length:2229 start_codon:yes stop_codon:yes gene_type:complete
MAIGWAYVDCDPEFVTGAFGPTGSIQFKDGHRSIRGAAELMWIRPGAEAEGYTAATSGDWNPSFLQVSGNVRVSGTVYANNFDVVTTTLTEIHQSGSTSFGQGTDRDFHSFTGSFQVTGSNTADGATNHCSYILDRFGIGTINPASSPGGSGNQALVEIQGTNGDGLTTFVIDSNDVDEVAMHIEAAQTTAKVLEITADSVTTGKVIDITCDSLSSGSALYIDDNSGDPGTRNVVSILQNNTAGIAATALNVQSDGGLVGIKLDKNYDSTNASAVIGMAIDLDKGNNTTSNNTIIGIDLDMDNATAANGTNTMTGIKVTPTLTHASDAGNPTVLGASIIATGGTNGTSIATAMELTSTGADTNNGLIINCADGGDDLVLLSSADTADNFKIAVTTAGATTITTVDGGGHAADLTFTIDGAIKLDGDGVEIENDSDSGAPALLIDNDDTDQIAIDVDAANIDADVVDITADAVTTANVLKISADGLTQGKAIFVEDNSSSTVARQIVRINQQNAAATSAEALYVQSDSRGGVAAIMIDRNADGTAAVDAVTGLQIDLDQTGEITSATGVVVGIQTDIETNVAGDGTLNSYGHRIVMTGDTDGNHTNTGLSINVGQADVNTHIELLSAADTGDYCSISVAAAGTTTIKTVDDGGAAADLIFDIDGDIIVNPAGSDVLPHTDNVTNLGSAAKRFANLHVGITHIGDLHLENERGNWLIVEEENYLSIRNQKTGKLYKFVLEEIEE